VRGFRFDVRLRKRKETMFSNELSYTLEAAYREAASRKHAFFCVEHLLYALLFDEEIVEIIKSCGGNDAKIKKDLEQFFEQHVEKVDDLKSNESIHVSEEQEEVGPIQTPAIQRVLQKAILQMHSAGKDTVTGKEVLVQIFTEKETHAAYFLAQQEIDRLDVINYVSHGFRRSYSMPMPMKRKQKQKRVRSRKREGRRARNVSIKRLSNLPKILLCGQKKANSIPLLEERVNLKECLRSYQGAKKTIRFFSAKRALGKLQWRALSPSE